MDKPLVLLDKILINLVESPYRTVEIEELYQSLYKNGFTDGYEALQLMEALDYLVSVNLITKSSHSGGYLINIEGHIKNSSGGFQRQYRNAAITRNLDWIQKTITPIIAASALVLSLVNSCTSSH